MNLLYVGVGGIIINTRCKKKNYFDTGVEMQMSKRRSGGKKEEEEDCTISTPASKYRCHVEEAEERGINFDTGVEIQMSRRRSRRHKCRTKRRWIKLTYPYAVFSDFGQYQ